MDLKTGETVIATDTELGNIFVRVENFLSVLANDQYHSIMKGQICHVVMEDGEVQTQFWSTFNLVQKPTATIYIKLGEIKHKVLLYPNEEDNFVVLDYSRPHHPLYPNCSMFS